MTYKYLYRLLILILSLPPFLHGMNESDATTRTFNCSTETMACSKNSAHTSEKIIFAELEHHTLRDLQHKLLPDVSEIIRQYVIISSHILDPGPRFIIKKRLNLTFYYLPNYQLGRESYILDALKAIQPHFNVGLIMSSASNLLIAPKLALFGDKRDEIVILIDDAEKSLSSLHNTVKAAAHTANNAYKSITNNDLFDIQKGERFPYVPHIALGRIDFGDLETKNSGMVESIKTRIEQDIFPLIDSWLASKEVRVHFNNLCLYDLAQKQCIKTYDLCYGMEDGCYTVIHHYAGD